MDDEILRKLIIDTSGLPGDIIAILYALGGNHYSLEVPLVTISNVAAPIADSLSNVISMFEQLKIEIEWRHQRRRGVGYASLRRVKPVVAIGASRPLSDATDESNRPTPEEIWRRVDAQTSGPVSAETKTFFRSNEPGHQEILRVLRENAPQTVTVVALTSLTTLALAAAADPETFLRAEEVVFLGGTLDAAMLSAMRTESNTYQDPLAAARVFALTSPSPNSTLAAPIYPDSIPQPLSLVVFPLESTNDFLIKELTRDDNGTADPPLTQWIRSLLSPGFAESDVPGKLRLRAPVTSWYNVTPEDWEWVMSLPQDMRIELDGALKGLCVIDTTNLKDDSIGMYVPGRWNDESRGNRLQICTNDCFNVYDITLWPPVLASHPPPGEED